MLKIILATLLFSSAALASPVVSQINPDDYWYSVNTSPQAQGADQSVVTVWYFKNDKNSEADACEVYYRRDGGEYYLQGWAINSAPELCIEISNEITSNIANKVKGTISTDTVTTFDDEDVLWNTEYNEQVSQGGLY